ncbi:aldehyde dehydrogenase (NADP(+)) [Carnimonas nigrificans]|uniref:aldehyde dehydrogenase (NADP(+)) n=1 Tax=Carnimonas nigrificans TaxID=64323 RepID=UPI000470C888|nr:aldehyde dehydrogenase (NADP(+)) [Carnimonas nigrificans]
MLYDGNAPTGMMLIGTEYVRGTQASVQGVAPATGERIEPDFAGATREEVKRACQLSAAAAPLYQAVPLEQRARFLDTIADNIEALGAPLVARAMLESGLTEARLTGERGRTANQLRMFARVIRDGGFLDTRIDPAQPDRQPLPRVDLRLRNVALGPVAVFGASNFPLAFSVAGGDTASALAAGCPVVVKAHSAHPGTSAMVGQAVADAVASCDMPEGVFSLLYGSGSEIGQALVADPRIKAVGFTGSRRGGLALVQTAQQRSEPIPVYAEMSAINPVLLFPEALKARAAEIGQAFAGALQLGAGQFCTNPGILFAVDGPELDEFVAAAKAALEQSPAQVMLTPGIHTAYTDAVEHTAGLEGAHIVARGQPGDGPNQCQSVLIETTLAAFQQQPAFLEELFGAASVLVRLPSIEALPEALEKVEGQLTIALHLEKGDYAAVRNVLPMLEARAGRLLVNGFGTGVEVSDAMVHGGPFPATSDGRTTSVGTLAIRRFLRPVSYQDFPPELLAEELHESNPLGVPRLYNGKLQLSD